MAALQKLTVISVPRDRYRVRIPGDLASTLGWPKAENGTDCLGIFRRHGELLCTAQALETIDRAQALQGIEALPEPPHGDTGSITEVPTAEELIQPFRVILFRAVWLKPPSNQLELQLSTANTERLGWTIATRAPIFAIAWSRYLLLMSEARYSEAHNAPLDALG